MRSIGNHADSVESLLSLAGEGGGCPYA